MRVVCPGAAYLPAADLGSPRLAASTVRVTVPTTRCWSVRCLGILLTSNSLASNLHRLPTAQPVRSRDVGLFGHCSGTHCGGSVIKWKGPPEGGLRHAQF